MAACCSSLQGALREKGSVPHISISGWGGGGNEEGKARRLIAEDLKEEGFRPGDLAKLPTAHPLKLKLAKRLRQQTPMTLGWIAATLHVGTRGSLANALREEPKGK